MVARLDRPHVICVYCDDSYDKDGVGKVFEALVKECGLVSQAYKCDANVSSPYHCSSLIAARTT
jgi:hypothetical protein